MAEELSPQDLLKALYWESSKGAGEVLRLVGEQWPAIAARAPSPHDAETCRLAMLAAAKLKHYDAAVVWRARATARFVLLDWHEGVAAIIMTDVFRLVAMANDDYPDGATMDVLRPSADALAIMHELQPFADGPGSGFEVGPQPSLIKRFIDEKVGFLLLLDRRFSEAEARYEQALLHAADEPRGRVKVRAGLELVRYLGEVESGRTGQGPAEATARIAADPATAQHADIAEIVAANSERMRDRRTDVLPYELL